VGGVLKGSGSGVVRREFGIKVTEDSYANGVAHVVIVLEHAKLSGAEVRTKIRRLVRRVKQAAENSVAKTSA
jgi:hypothetical protein